DRPREEADHASAVVLCARQADRLSLCRVRALAARALVGGRIRTFLRLCGGASDAPQSAAHALVRPRAARARGHFHKARCHLQHGGSESHVRVFAARGEYASDRTPPARTAANMYVRYERTCRNLWS